jgi:UDP-galactopyranose mutase
MDMDFVFPTYLMSFPNNFSFTRIMEYKHQSQQKFDGKTLISFDFPFDSRDNSEPCEEIYLKESSDFLETHFPGKTISMFCESRRLVYPVSEKESIDHFWNLLKSNISDNWISFGRLGLYSYISMDTCVQQCIDVINVIEKWKNISEDEKMSFYQKLRNKQT